MIESNWRAAVDGKLAAEACVIDKSRRIEDLESELLSIRQLPLPVQSSFSPINSPKIIPPSATAAARTRVFREELRDFVNGG